MILKGVIIILDLPSSTFILFFKGATASTLH
jgi:hypothetical protein